MIYTYLHKTVLVILSEGQCPQYCEQRTVSTIFRTKDSIKNSGRISKIRSFALPRMGGAARQMLSRAFKGFERTSGGLGSSRRPHGSLQVLSLEGPGSQPPASRLQPPASHFSFGVVCSSSAEECPRNTSFKSTLPLFKNHRKKNRGFIKKYTRHWLKFAEGSACKIGPTD